MTNIIEEYHEDKLKANIVDEISGGHEEIYVWFKDDAKEEQISEYIKKLPPEYIISGLIQNDKYGDDSRPLLKLKYQTKWSKVLEVAIHVDDNQSDEEVLIYMENGSWDAIQKLISIMGKNPIEVFPGAFDLDEDSGEDMCLVFVFEN